MPKLTFQLLDMEVLDWQDEMEEVLDVSLYRAKVPGGWLMMLADATGSLPEEGAGLVFLPDPGHTWDGNSLP